MITDLLVEHSALVPAAMVLVAVVCVCAGIAALRSGATGRRALWFLVVLGLIGVFALTLLPSPGNRAYETCTVQFSMPSLTKVGLLANVALFFPLVYFATLASRRPLLVLFGGMVLSGGIEAVQAAITEIGRSCDTNDWVMNSAGTVAAVIFALATLLIAGRNAERHER